MSEKAIADRFEGEKAVWQSGGLAGALGAGALRG